MAKKKSVADYAMWTIMLLLVLGLMGIGTRQFTSGKQSVGHVGTQEISAQAYARALNQALTSYSQKLGTQLTLKQSEIFGLPQQVLSQLVAQAALDNEDNRIGISVGDARVAREVEQMAGFQGAGGKFDPTVYRATLKQVGLTVSEFETEIRNQIARTILQTAVGSGIAAPDAATTAFLDYALSTRDISFLRIDPAQLDAPVPAPTDAELQAYFKDHASDYTVPETKHITYILLTPEMLAPTIKVDEATLKQDYEAKASQYNVPERRVVERLVFLDKAKADAAEAQLKSGATTFEALVKERGLTMADVTLGDQTKEQLGTAGDAVFAVAKAGDTVVAPTPLGPAIFRVNAILAPKSTPFDAVRADLLKQEQLKQAGDKVTTLSTKIDDLLAGGATLEDVAKETPAQLATIAWTQDSKDGIAADPKFDAAAAKVTASDYPQVTDGQNGSIFALRLDKTDPSRPQTFDEAKAAVAKAVTAQKTGEALKAKAEAELAAIKGGADMATEPGKFSTLKAQTRNSVGEGLTPEGLKTAFEMKPGELQVVGDSTAAYVIRLDATHAPDLKDPKVAAARTKLESDIANSIGQDVLSLYAKSLEDTAGVSLNQAVINAVHSQFP